MLGELDDRIRETRRQIEERRHLRSCLKESVNDIRRYRRLVKESERAAVAFDDPARAREPQGVAAHLRRQVTAGVLDEVLAERDALRVAMDDAAAVEARWSELVAERERRLAALPGHILDRLGEVEERQGVVLGQNAVGGAVREAGRHVLDALGAARALVDDPVAFPPALVRVQTRILAFRRAVKHMHIDAVRLEEPLSHLLDFADSACDLWGQEVALGRPHHEVGRLLDATMARVERLLEATGRFLVAGDERVLAEAAVALSIPA